MAKYSTGDSDKSTSSKVGSSCSLCGKESGSLTKEKVAGASVTVCRDCASKHATKSEDSRNKDRERDSNENKNEKENKENVHTKYMGYNADRDSSWVEETRPDYGNAKTPYLVHNYAKKLINKLSEENISSDELSERTGLSEDTVNAILDGNAISNDVSKEAISKIEEVIDIKLQESL